MLFDIRVRFCIKKNCISIKFTIISFSFPLKKEKKEGC